MQKSCRQCASSFEITDQDLKFYGKVSPDVGGKKFLIPPPTMCPPCRSERRLAFRNERSLYNGTCALCHKAMVTAYAPESPFAVFCNECWWSDKWDSLKFGRDLDFDRPFFDQFAELQKVVPRLGMLNINSENSEYTSYGSGNKDCYMTVASDNNERCFYGNYVWNSYECVDCTYLIDSKHCYECIDGVNLYECQFCQECEAASNCFGCYDCKNVSDCFGSYGLRHKQFYFLNERLSESAYRSRVTETMVNFQQAVSKARSLHDAFPHRPTFQINSENCLGDHLKGCKNVLYGFDGYGGEDCKWIANFPGDTRDCYDCEGVAQIELSAECVASGIGTQRLFACDHCLNGNTDEYYSSWCFGSHHLFGSIGLRHQAYCVLNKQYSKEEYEVLVPKIIEHMKTAGDFGEFFPTSVSPFAYNESAAMDHFRLTKDQALMKKYRWRDPDQKSYQSASVTIPSKIDDVQDSIANEVLACVTCGKNYRIISQELAFYRRYQIPIPQKCHDCRHRDRMSLRNPRKLWPRQCTCGNGHDWHKAGVCPHTFQTTYAPDRPEKVYCEECYLKEVY